MNYGSLNSLNNLRCGDIAPFNPRSISGLKLLVDSSNQTAYMDGAIEFTAGDKAYLTSASTDFNLGTADFAFNIWIYRGATGAKVFATKYQDANNYWEFGVNASNILYFIAKIGGSTLIRVIGTTAITTLSTWYNVAINISRTAAGSCKIYLSNGSTMVDDTVAGASTSASTIDNTGAFIFGANGALTVFCTGRKDSFGIWKGGTVGTGETLDVELALNPGFETPGTGGADIWDTWVASAGDGAIADTTTAGEFHSGAHAVKMTSGAGHNTSVYQHFTLTASTRYKVTLWTRGDGTSSGRYQVYDNTNSANLTPLGATSTGVTGTTYSQITFYFTTTTGTDIYLYLKCPSTTSGIAYFDDFSIKKVTASNTLSAGDITDMYNAGAGRMYNDLTTSEKTNLSMWFGFNEEDGVRYDNVSTNHLSQAFANIIDNTSLNGGFESLGTGETLGSELVLNQGFETAGTNGGTISGTKTSTEARAANVAMIVTATPHGLVNGNVATIAGMTDATFNASSVTVTRIDDTTFTYANTGSTVTTQADTTGTITTAVFANWNLAVGNGIIAKTTTAGEFHTTSAAKLTAGATPATTPDVDIAFATTENTRYKFTFWTRGDATNAGRFLVYDVSNSVSLVAQVTTGITSATYSQVTVYFTTATGGISTLIVFRPAAVTGAIAYFDDVSVKQVTASNTFLNWTDGPLGSSTINVETASPYAGTYNVRFDLDAAGSFASVAQTVLTTGHKYKVTAEAKSSSAGAYGRFDLGTTGNNVLTLTTSYAIYTVYGTAVDTTFRVARSGGNSISLYYDDVTLVCTEIPSAAGIAAGLAIDGNLAEQFNGTNQYNTIADNASINFATGNFSIFGAFNRDKTGQSTLMSKYQDANNYWTLEMNASDILTFRAYAGGAKIVEVIGTIALAVDNYYKFALNVDRTTAANCKIYIDNVNDTAGTPTTGATSITNTGDLFLARYNATLYFKGREDGFGMLKRILTTGEITAMFNGGKYVKYAGLPTTVSGDALLVAFWNLDEFSAGTSNVTRLDSTANHNDLTASGNPPSAQGVDYHEGSVGKWKDQSGLANDLIQTTQSSRLLYVTNAQNGKPVLRGDGLTKSLYNLSDLIVTGNISVVVVVKLRSFGGNTGKGIILTNGKFILYGNTTNACLNVTSDASTTAVSATSSISLATAYVVIVTRTVTTGLVNIFINGVLSGSADQNSGTPTSSGVTQTTVGNSSAGTSGFDGDIDAVDIYQKIMTASEIANETRFYKIKFGI